MNITQDAPADILHDYARLKLELAAIIRALLHIADRRKDEISVQECRRLLARLAEDRFNLAILGQFSRGKSSLMNALLGSDKLPTGVLPLTSVITTVTYGESEKVLLQRDGWPFPQEIRLNELPEYVTQQGNPGNEKRVTLAQIQLPNELLRLGVHFIDTPGVASAIAANTRTTRKFLPEADAAILVTSFESPMTETELTFLQEIREHVRQVFVVVNKLDSISPADRDPVLESVRETLGAVFPDSGPDIFAVSARDALHAKQDRSSEALEASGLPRLETALTDFLRRDKARELLLRTADRTTNLARQQELAIRIAQHAGSPQEAALLEQRLQERVANPRHACESIIRRMHNRLRLEFPRWCEEEIGLWNPEAETLLISELQNWFSREGGEISGPSFEEFLQRVSHRLFSNWLSRHQVEVNRVFQEQAQRDNVAIEDLTGRISRIPVEVLGSESTGSPPPQPLDTGMLVFGDIRVPLTTFQVPWWYEILPAGRARNFVVRGWLRRIPEFVNLYRSAAFSLLQTAVDDWVENLNRQLLNRITRTESHVSGLLTQKAELTELPEIEQLFNRVQGFVKAVLRMGTEGGESPGSTAFSKAAGSERAASVRPCVICLRVERALWDFMAHRQYDLAVSESDQRQHALRSGFCPLHTWQYEAISSPQGVCAAYPQLLTLFAKRLRLLAQDSTSVQSIESGVRSMLPKETLCPACQLIASIEKAAAYEFARQLTGGDGSSPAICVFHLRSILAAGPELKAAARLVLEEAAVLERLAEDMQNHILKHEAVSHHLSTNAEREAAIAGPSRLVGRRDTVAPRRVE